MAPQALDRVAAVEAGPAGAVRPSGLASFKDALAAHAGGFASWREHPFTRVYRAALSELLLRPSSDSSDVAFHYGLMQGIALARQLCDDPSMVWPEVMTEGASGGKVASLPDMDFETPIDNIFETARRVGPETVRSKVQANPEKEA